MRFNIFILVAIPFLLTGCADYSGPKADHSEDNKIGTNLAAVSSVTSEQGGDQSKMAIYDSTVCMIHQFDMGTGTYMRTLKPVITGGDHKVLFDPTGNYVIDFSAAHISIFSKEGVAQDPQLSFVGMPTNASFRPSMGYLVLQDDVKTAGLIKIDSLGNVVGRAPMGQIVHDDVSILAGDINDSGQLVMALSDNSIGIFDISQTIATHKWVMTSNFPSGLVGINWVGSIHDNPNQILVKTTDADNTVPVQIAIIDTVAKTVVGSIYTVPTSRLVVKTSKGFDPHFILKDSGNQFETNATLIFAQGSVLHTKTLPDQIRNVMSSFLRLTDDSWSLVDSAVPQVLIGFNWHDWFLYDDPNASLSGRLMKKYMVSQMLALSKITLPDSARVQISESHIFELFPNPLGQAINVSIGDGSAKKLDNFNHGFFHSDPCH